MNPLEKIAFIGVGAMGRPIALRILKSGRKMIVCDKDPAALDVLVREGAIPAATPAEAARGADAIFVMVPDAPDAELVALGADGVSESARRGALYVDMSTIDPITTRRIGAAMRERGIRMVDCPVGRTTEHAERGELVLMLGGADDDIDAVMPILSQLGDTFIRCGLLGNGSATKLINNYVALACSAISAEAFVLGVKAGLTVEHLLSVFGSTMAANAQALKLFPEFALAGRSDPGFMVALGHKDVRLALSMGEEYGCATPVGQATFEVLGTAINAGFGRKDCSSLLMMHEETAGTTVRLRT